MKKLFASSSHIGVIQLKSLIVTFILVICICNNFFAQETTPLRNAFSDDFLIGAALNSAQFQEKDKIGASIAKTHFNTITPENELKWERVHPQPDQYTFEVPDKFVDFGLKNNMFIVGHTLVWHSQTPRWVFEGSGGAPADRETLLSRMREHIMTVVGRYKGKIKGWDVVNEALNEDGTLRQSPWLKIIGEDFIEKAFQYAHEADPEAELYYNDYSIENEAKRNGVIRLVKQLQAKGITIKGIGIQHHVKMDWPSTGQLDSTIKAFAQLGVDVMITEFDIDVLPAAVHNRGADVSMSAQMRAEINPYVNGLPDSVQQKLSDRYQELFKVLKANREYVSRVTFWGVTDKESWLNNWPVRGRTSYPLLFDREGKPKPAFYAILKASER